MLIRDQPIFEHIVEQHAEEAAFLWTQRDRATDSSLFTRRHLARLDERIEAHVDGLRVAGEGGWRIALGQLARQCAPGELFAASVLALESGNMARIEPLVAIAATEDENIRRGFVGAIAWCEAVALRQVIRTWFHSEDFFCRYLALCACSVHRAQAGKELDACIGDNHPQVRARAFRLAAELGMEQYLEDCLFHLKGSNPHECFWAAWAAVLLGNREPAVTALRTFALNKQQVSGIALEVSVRAMGIELGMSFIRELNDDPSLRRLAISAAGYLGDPAIIPWLVEQMNNPATCRIAGDAFSTITGADFTSQHLALPVDSGPKAEQDGEDEALATPNTTRIRMWWAEQEHRFTMHSRYLCGRSIDASNCLLNWHSGFQRQRRAAAYELALTSKKQFMWNWRQR